MRLPTKSLIIICAWHPGWQPAAAATILTGPGDFTGATTLVDFETFPGGAGVPYNYQAPGILGTQWGSTGFWIADSSPGDGAGAYNSTYKISPHSGSHAIADSDGGDPEGFIDFHFVIPGTGIAATVYEAGLWVQNGDEGSRVSFFDADGGLIQSLTPLPGDQFAGLRAPQGIGRIRISDEGYYMVDDLQFGVAPEPSGVALMACGAVLACTLRRRPSK